MTRILPNAGPIAGGTVATLTGTNLAAVTGVRVGSTLAAKILSRTRTAVKVRMPKLGHAGTAVVYIQYASAWHNSSKTFTYVAAPAISRISGTPTVFGGQTVAVSGTNLQWVSQVVVGRTAMRITSKTASVLKFATTTHAAGSYPVVLVSPGGRASHALKYVVPSPVSTGSVAPRTETFAQPAAAVQWVYGGPSHDIAYIVSVAPGSALPTVGQAYFLAPGSTVYPSGMAGTVRSLAGQTDGSTRISVEATALSDVLKGYKVNYIGAPGTATTAARGTTRARAADRSWSWDKGPVKCDGGSESPSVTGSVAVGGLTPEFKFDDGGLFGDPDLRGGIAGSFTVTASFSTSAQVHCHLAVEFQNTHKWLFIGPDGASVSVAPDFQFDLSGQAGGKISQTFNFAYQLHQHGLGGSPTVTHDVQPQAPTYQISAQVDAELDLGALIQLGLLDRIGLGIQVDLYAKGSAAAPTGNTTSVDVELELGLKVTVNFFLDLWVHRWTKSLATAYFPFGRPVRYHLARDPGPGTNPAIKTTSLPDAQSNAVYSAALLVTDSNNTGTWTGGAGLPAGLSVHSSGIVDGTPAATPAAYTFSVTYTSSTGKTTSGLVSLNVVPEPGLGGGAIQARLTWNSPADLDLHGWEPDGTEIWYSNKTSPTTSGALDHDQNAACGEDVEPAAENMHWDTPPPAGEYQFQVQLYDNCGTSSQPWHLSIFVGGQLVFQTDGTGTGTTYRLHYGSGTPTVS